MRSLRRLRGVRATVLLLLLFSLGVLAGAIVDVYALRLPFAVLAASLAGGALAIHRRLPNLGTIALAGALLAGGLALPRHALPVTVAPGLYRATIDVLSTEHGQGDVSSLVMLRQGTRLEDGLPLPPQRARLRGALPAGARVRALAKLRPVARFRNRSPHVPWPARRATAAGRVVGPVSTVTAGRWAALRERARAEVRASLETTLPPISAGVARALVLGDRRAVDEERRAIVRGAGLAHVLAVSGLHVAVTVGFAVFAIGFILRRIPVIAARFDSTRVACTIGVPLAYLYGELAGGAPSARRAALTAAVAFAVRAAARRPSPLGVAAFAIALLVAVDPEGALDPGLLLSVLATLSILTMTRPDELAGSGARANIRTAVVISARATLSTAPVVWWCFGAVPAVSVLANVLLAPFAALGLLPLALLHAATATGLPALSGVTSWLFVHAEGAFAEACALLAAIPIGQDLPPPTLGQGLVAIAATAALLLLRRPRSLLVAAAAALLVLGALEWKLCADENEREGMRVTFVDVGQGDASVVDLPDGRLMLIDGGGGPGRPGRYALLPLLRARRRARIDIAVLTHPHPDHYEGLIDLAESLPIGELWDSGQGEAEDPTGPVAHLLEALRARGTRVLGPPALCGPPRHFGGARLTVLAPCPRYDPGYDPNDNSLVLALRYGVHRFLFTGDAEAFEEGSLVTLGADLRADVLAVGHHGSRTSSTPAFLARVAPRLSVISAGQHNRYGHPHSEVFERLARAGRVLTTAQRGGVEVRTDGHTLRARTPLLPWFEP